jgi:hypothetical protein
MYIPDDIMLEWLTQGKKLNKNKFFAKEYKKRETPNGLCWTDSGNLTFIKMNIAGFYKLTSREFLDVQKKKNEIYAGLGSSSQSHTPLKK